MSGALIKRAISNGNGNHLPVLRSHVRHGHAASDRNSGADDGVFADEAPVGRHHVS